MENFYGMIFKVIELNEDIILNILLNIQNRQILIA
jgi:hypothetical protein